METKLNVWGSSLKKTSKKKKKLRKRSKENFLKSPEFEKWKEKKILSGEWRDYRGNRVKSLWRDSNATYECKSKPQIPDKVKEIFGNHVKNTLSKHKDAKNCMIEICQDIACGENATKIRRRVNKSFAGCYTEKILVINMLDDVIKNGF